MFQLTEEEFEKLRNDLIFQNGISRWGGTRKLPPADDKPRRPIGFIQPKDEDDLSSTDSNL